MALAVLFIATPLVTGTFEVFALNLVGLACRGAAVSEGYAVENADKGSKSSAGDIRSAKEIITTPPPVASTHLDDG